ncbi:hypothetical protein JCM18882A_33060 [Brevibacterium metallidurans]|uniref:Uncharacterized protein n=1 Tax=Brevibacterium metallidurans TaxID=1482676 RepID=A0ABN0SSZ3_9MICO
MCSGGVPFAVVGGVPFAMVGGVSLPEMCGVSFAESSDMTKGLSQSSVSRGSCACGLREFGLCACGLRGCGHGPVDGGDEYGCPAHLVRPARQVCRGHLLGPAHLV